MKISWNQIYCINVIFIQSSVRLTGEQTSYTLDMPFRQQSLQPSAAFLARMAEEEIPPVVVNTHFETFQRYVYMATVIFDNSTSVDNECLTRLQYIYIYPMSPDEGKYRNALAQ